MLTLGFSWWEIGTIIYLVYVRHVLTSDQTLRIFVLKLGCGRFACFDLFTVQYFVFLKEKTSNGLSKQEIKEVSNFEWKITISGWVDKTRHPWPSVWVTNFNKLKRSELLISRFFEGEKNCYAHSLFVIATTGGCCREHLRIYLKYFKDIYD